MRLGEIFVFFVFLAWLGKALGNKANNQRECSTSILSSSLVCIPIICICLILLPLATLGIMTQMLKASLSPVLFFLMEVPGTMGVLFYIVVAPMPVINTSV